MGKDPAFLFYPGDWLGGTMGMTFEEKGAYIELLIYQFNNGKFSEKEAIQIVGENWNKISKKFTQKNDLFFNLRLDEEIEKRIKYSESRRNNRLKSKKHMKNISKTYVKHMENENENENKDKYSIIYPFDSKKFTDTWELWKAYRKEKKLTAYKPIGEQAALKKLSKFDEETACQMIMQSIENGWQGIFELKNQKNGKHRKIDYQELLGDLQDESSKED